MFLLGCACGFVVAMAIAAWTGRAAHNEWLEIVGRYHMMCQSLIRQRDAAIAAWAEAAERLEEEIEDDWWKGGTDAQAAE
jgi:hypothetical protein